MDPLIYFLAEHFPWWGIPLGLIFAETGNHFRRTGSRAGMVLCFTLSITLFGLAATYFVMNGFENLRPAMQRMEKEYSR